MLAVSSKSSLGRSIKKQIQVLPSLPSDTICSSSLQGKNSCVKKKKLATLFIRVGRHKKTMQKSCQQARLLLLFTINKIPVMIGFHQRAFVLQVNNYTIRCNKLKGGCMQKACYIKLTKKYIVHEWHETCHSVAFHFLKKDSKRCYNTTTPESIHTKDESKRGSAFAFIFCVN